MNSELKSQIRDYRKTNWEGLLREDLGKHHLKEIKPHLDKTKNIIDSLIEPIENINLLSDDEQSHLLNILSDFNNMTREIKNHGDISQNQNLMDRVNGIIESILGSGNPLLLALKEDKKYSSNQNLGQSKADVKKYQSIVKELKTKLKEAQEIQKETLKSQEAIKKLQSQQKGQIVSKEASQYGDFFRQEANQNERRSWFYWFFVIFLSGISCYLAYGFFSFDPNIQATSIPELIIKGNLINKIFVFSILFFLISFLSREYMALRHQCTLNQHRHNALASHKEILTSIKETTSESDKEISNAILLELTKAMFTPQDTGFIKNQKTSSVGDKIIEISKPILKTPSTRE